MSQTATYHTTVRWKGEHWGHLVMGNGPEMDFSAPPDAHGSRRRLHARGRLRRRREHLRDDDVHLGRPSGSSSSCSPTSAARRARSSSNWTAPKSSPGLHFRPMIRVAACGDAPAVVEARVRRALQSAQKYSLVANSVKSEIVIEPEILSRSD